MTQRAVSVGFLLAALVIIAQAFTIPSGAAYQAVGPRVFPLLVGGGLAFVAVIGVVQAFTAGPGSRPEIGTDSGPVDGRRVILLLVALAGYALVLTAAGYWQATTVFFVVVARILGSKRLPRDTVVGLVLALATYFLFDRVLGIALPPGFIRLAI